MANPAGERRKATLQNLFGIDPRSLALFRMAMGALLLTDLAIRATDLKVMYTDDEMGFQLFRLPVAEFLCRNWNAQNVPAKQVIEFELIYCMENSAQTEGASSPQIFHEPLLHLDLHRP